jgi:hypothetical protein
VVCLNNGRIEFIFVQMEPPDQLLPGRSQRNEREQIELILGGAGCRVLETKATSSTVTSHESLMQGVSDPQRK